MRWSLWASLVLSSVRAAPFALPLRLNSSETSHTLVSRLPAAVPTHIPLVRRRVVRRRGIVQRASQPGSLWGSDGIADIMDIRQTVLPNCGLISALGALITLNPDWVYSLISFTGSAAEIQTATYSIVNFNTREKVTQTVSKAGLHNDRGDREDSWWVGGLEQAVLQSSQLSSMLPSEALTVLTGMKAGYHWTKTSQPAMPDALTMDQVWSVVSVRAKKTPLVLQTMPSSCRTLITGHAYAIFGGTVAQDGTRSVILWDPHGETNTHELEDIWGDWYLLHGFADLNADFTPAQEQTSDPISDPNVTAIVGQPVFTSPPAALATPALFAELDEMAAARGQAQTLTYTRDGATFVASRITQTVTAG